VKPTTSWRVRPYTPRDREAVRRICCETGYSGEPIDPVFGDRDVFADFFTRYYTDFEPESAWVAEVGGEVVGYLIGCCRFRYHAWVEKFLLLVVIAPKAVWRFCTGRYNQASRKFLFWSCGKATGETPSAPKRSAHFHFNILSAYRNTGIGYKLFFTFYKQLQVRGVAQVYGQIQTFDDRRAIRIFERYGFTEFDRKELTKFKDFQEKKVYCSTLVKKVEV
jgi:GNAT superfamily N-acetyltransferase